MSVPKWRRQESRLDAFYEAVKLRHIVMHIILKTFGMKCEYKPLITNKLKETYPELEKKFKQIEKYQLEVEETKELEKYEDWFVEKLRNNLFEYTSNLVKHISAANEIKCEIDREYQNRISLEDEAICDIENIKQEVQFIEEFFNINLNRYMDYAEQLEKTRNYLHRWKKSTIKSYKKFKEGSGQ